MREYIKKYYQTLNELFSKVVVTYRNGKETGLEEGTYETINMILKQSKLGGKLIFIGNGASAAMASHMAVDFWKNAGIKAVAFNDASLLTCISNDYGYQHVFEKPIEMFAEQEDILFAISSSGQSENILRGAVAVKKKGLKVITLSGFNKDNLLSKLGDINFYVPIANYGHVEIIHLSICHCLVDIIMENKSKSMDIENPMDKRMFMHTIKGEIT